MFDELHGLVTKEFLKRLKDGTATTSDLKAACDWLKANDISGVATKGTPLRELQSMVPKIDPEFVRSRLNRTYQ